MYTAIQVAGENVNGECMFDIQKNGNLTGTSIAAHTRREAVQRYKRFLKKLAPLENIHLLHT